MQAIWKIGDTEIEHYPALAGKREADVVVIGAGITGLTTALQLAEDGSRVIVLEALSVGEGCTGGSTGNLYSPLAKGLSAIRKKWGDDVSRDIVTSRIETIDFIEATIERFAIDCQFHRRPLYRLFTTADEVQAYELDEERKALLEAGLEVEDIEQHVLPFSPLQGLKINDQAQFNPLLYVQGLAKAVSAMGVTILEHSPVRDVDYKQGVVKTDTAAVTARHIVHATHTPKGVDLLQTGMLPSREYGVSAKLNGEAYPEGIFWMLDPFHSLRSYRYAGESYLMVIGEKHKTGEGKYDYYQRLREYLSQHFDVQEFCHQWSAQQYSSADGLPYIGRMHARDNVYVATGFAADGLTWGTLAGRIIADLIHGRDNTWHAHFDARRITPAKSAGGWVKENASVTKHLVQDYLATGKLKEFAELAPGEAKVATLDGEKLAIYRNESGELSVLSAVCPHMKCLVHWNANDTTWDCPCHGSRFDTRGDVIEGPAYHALERRDPPVDS
ncbi:FAD-dependent oxidoreductase [Halomonas sp. Bachu 37]|uniref:FAD-dependent oxidoreductase n=1 Tax=Halomonas kashgarensis TaxID=3084920 RepID=UPI003217B69F